jgi:diacylglycerol kinase family enzyme
VAVTALIAGGGDGTINAVADALIGKGREKPAVTLGVFPLGTANDFARGCELPADDLAECLRIACTREGRPIDVGVMNKRNFINVASMGFGAEITATTPVELKKRLGGGAYTLMGMVKAMNLTPYTGRLLIPGQDVVVLISRHMRSSMTVCWTSRLSCKAPDSTWPNWPGNSKTP